MSIIWRIDGNYRKTLEMRINKADTVILLEISGIYWLKANWEISRKFGVIWNY